MGEAGRIAVPTSLSMLVHPHLEVLAQLRRLEHAPAGPGAGRCAVAAGAAAFLDGAYAEADRILGLAVDRLDAGDQDRWAAHYLRGISRMFTGAPPAVEADAHAVLADIAAPAWSKVGLVCCAALIRLYHGDRTEAPGVGRRARPARRTVRPGRGVRGLHRRRAGGGRGARRRPGLVRRGGAAL
ncbi:MAG: hypothetical protein ACLGI2_14895 [Acidimicrobiia bacterium]